MRLVQRVDRRWGGETVIVAGSGPSLSMEVAYSCIGWKTIVVNDAYRRLPWANVLYGADAAWWEVHEGAPQFCGERWSCAEGAGKDDAASRYELTLVHGEDGRGFSVDQTRIHYGNNSGFQAINLALLFGAARVVLVGFDMRGEHFFGRHPMALQSSDPRGFIPAFKIAAKMTKAEIINATPGSALSCFKNMSLEEVLQ